MFFIEGKIIALNKDWILLKTKTGFGFKIFLPEREINSLNLFESKRIYTYPYFNLNQNHFLIFGFLEERELFLFEILISLPKIGPKSALAIFNLADLDTLISAIKNQKTEFFYKIPGLGKTTAQRIVLELSSKINQIEKLALKEIKDKDFELIEILESLGYPKEKILSVLKEIEPNLSLEEKIKSALKILSQKN